jgi:hypothetical protein
MTIGRFRFMLKIAVAMIASIAGLFLIGLSVQATTTRFGNPGWIHLIIGLLAFVAGLIVAWSSAVSWLDQRNLRALRARPGDAFKDGQQVALSGTLRVSSAPLEAPFSKKACACYSYQVNGRRRTSRANDNHYRQQLCLLGFEMAETVLDCGTSRLPLRALPDVDTDFRSTGMGGALGDRALHWLGEFSAGPLSTEADAREAVENARLHIQPPQSASFFVAPTQGGANAISVLEDAVPVNVPVTVLAAYASLSRSLDGRRPGGMKIFAGGFDERLAALDGEYRKGLTLGVPLLVIGLGLLSLAWWLPA